MNLKEYIIQQSDKFIKRLEIETDLEAIETKDWGWENHLYRSKSFRQAHIERYFHDNLMVLHITVFPHKNNTYPMFGFDLIVLPKSDKISAAFLDYSPTYTNVIWIAPNFKNGYELPEWTDGVFSPYFVACRPEEDEYQILFDTALNMFDTTLKKLKSDIYNTESEIIIGKIIEAQNRYCGQQWNNKRTFGALKAKIGNEGAEYFIKNILFPKIET
jgi:hypothetical protein